MGDILINLIKVASVQFRSEPGNVKRNLEKSTEFIAQAKEKGATLVVLPELFNVGYDLNLLKNTDSTGHRRDFEQSLACLSEAAQKYKVCIVAGLLEIQDDRYYNSAIAFSEKGILATYRKLALFPLSGEAELFSPGGQTVTFTIEGFKFGIMICFDIRFPEIGRKYMEDDCSCIIVSSAFPFPRIDHWRSLLKSRAIENQFYIVAANRVGTDNNICFLGNSCIIDPWGTVKATANESEETIVFYELDREKIIEVRGSIPTRESFDHLQRIL